MQFNIIFKTIFEYIHKKFRFDTFCEYRKKTTRIASRASCFLHEKNYHFLHGSSIMILLFCTIHGTNVVVPNTFIYKVQEYIAVLHIYNGLLGQSIPSN